MQQQTKKSKNWSLLKLMKIGVPDALVFSGLFVGSSPLWRRMPGQRRRKVGHENNCAPFCRWWRRLHSLHATFKTPSEQCLNNLMLQHLRWTLWCTEADYQLLTSSSCSTAWCHDSCQLALLAMLRPLRAGRPKWLPDLLLAARCSKLALKGMHCVIRSWGSFSW